MKDYQADFISLIRSALQGTEPHVSASFDYNQAYELAEAQQLTPLLCYGLMQIPSFLNSEAASSFLTRVGTYISHSARQMEILEQICDNFDDLGIDYMPIKGAILKQLYPSPEMRVMGDLDILVKIEQYPLVAPIMKSMGFTAKQESDHEWNWENEEGIYIELHKRLIPSYNKDYYAYYGNGWRLAHPSGDGSCRFEMTPEDQLIYLFTHFAKHYRDQGVGMKYAIDFYIFREHYPDLREDYIRQELEKLQLLEFYVNISDMLNVWFCKSPSTDMTDYLTNKLFEDGVFGREDLNTLSEALKVSKNARKGESIRRKRMWQVIFPSYANMCLRYPFLQHWAILLPLMWIVRIFDVFLFHRDRYRHQRDRTKLMTDENIGEYQKSLNYVGLDFHFTDDYESGTPPNRE